MLIRLLRNLGTRDGYPPWKIGEEVDADDELGDKLIARGLAEAIKAPNATPETVKAVPPKAELSGVPQKSTIKSTTAAKTNAANK